MVDSSYAAADESTAKPIIQPAPLVALRSWGSALGKHVGGLYRSGTGVAARPKTATPKLSPA